MMKLSLLVVLACLAVALAEPRVSQRGVIHQIQKGVAGPNPYIFLTVPKGRSQALVQGFEVIEENDNKTDNEKPVAEDEDEEDADIDDEVMAEDNDYNEDDDDEDDDQQMDDEDVDNDEEETNHSLDKNEDGEDNADDDDELDNVMNMNLKLRKSNAQIKQAKSTQMMVSREHAGAILVPDEVIEIEGQSVIDEKTGKPALLLPRAILDTIPDGSVVALMERSSEDEPEARANRVIVRRRRKGARRNIKRRRGGNNRRRVNRQGPKRRVVNRRVVNKRRGNNRRRNNRRKNVRVVRRGNRRRGNKRRTNRRRVSLQG